MTIYFASDHAGLEMKNVLLAYVQDELGYDVEDCGAYEFDPNDDYPDFIQRAATKVSESPNDRAIILGASGQGEAMAANRLLNVRAAVFYGEPAVMQTDADENTINMVVSTRVHNDANVLSLGARFLSVDEAKAAIRTWLTTPFSEEVRHVRRIAKLDAMQEEGH